MMTSSNGNIFRVTGPLCGEFTGDLWITRTKASDAELWCFFDLHLNKRLSKQSWGWWFETPSPSLWRHYHVEIFCIRCIDLVVTYTCITYTRDSGNTRITEVFDKFDKFMHPTCIYIYSIDTALTILISMHKQGKDATIKQFNYQSKEITQSFLCSNIFIMIWIKWLIFFRSLEFFGFNNFCTW